MGTYANPRTFVVAWVSFYDNELHQEVVQDLHSWGAMMNSSQNIVPKEDFHFISSIHKLKVQAFDNDGMISVIEVMPE